MQIINQAINQWSFRSNNYHINPVPPDELDNSIFIFRVHRHIGAIAGGAGISGCYPQ